VRALAGCRIAIIGTTGAGKTTLALRIARTLDVPHVELDALHWGPGWTEASLQLFRERVARALEDTGWVVDGNYHQVRDLVWLRADTLVWLDYPFLVVIGRLLWRTLCRLLGREELWGGNRESWRAQFLSRDSILLWAIKTHWRRRREYPRLLNQPEYAHLAVVHLRSPWATRAWLAGLGRTI
jgi:adenylate kinase family enzyme